jgi:hypothetical protein
MNTNALALAKDRLRIPELWRLLGLPGEPAKSCRVPWREDQNPSGSVYEDGRRFHDHATGEDFDAPDFLARARNVSLGEAIKEFKRLAGVEDAAPAAPPSRSNALPRMVATYDYFDEAGALLYQVCRFEPKTFRQRRPDASARDGWTWKLEGTRRVLYRLPEVLVAVAACEPVFIAEGEKDCAALVTHGFAATCNPGGAGKWLDDYTATLRGADVVLIADKDEAGRRHVQLVASKLHGIAKTLRIVELPDFDGQPVKDAADYFVAGATAEDFRAVVTQAVPFTLTTAPQDVSNPLPALPEEDEPEAAPFPLAALPPTMALLVSAVARCERVPLALPGVCALGVISAAIGAGLEVTSGPNRATRGNLFLLASAESGSGKSETFRLVAAPLVEYQQRQLEVWKEKTSPQIQSEVRVLDKEMASLEKKAAKSSDPMERDRLVGELEYKLARKDDLTRKAALPCTIAQDVTTERLAVLLRDNREVVFSASADARKLVDNLLGRYNPGKTTDESLYLSGFSGDFIRVDRQGRETVVLNHPCLALCWFIQPDLLATMLGEESLSASGFLPRLLLCHTQATPRRIEGEAQALSDHTRGQWAQLVSGLLATFHDAEKPHRITAAPEAAALLTEFHNHVVDRRAVDLADVGAFAARYAEQAWRVAVVLHAVLHGAEAGGHTLTLETAQHAVGLVEWFSAAQLDILAKGRRAAAEKVEEEVIELLATRQERQRLDYVTAREVHRARIVSTADAGRALLARMEREGLLTGEDVRPAHGGKTTRIFRAVGGTNPVPG